MRRKWEDARYRRLLAPGSRPLPPLALAPRTRPAGMQTEPQVESATSAGVILPETVQFLLLCSLQLWCNIVVKLVQECNFLTHFTSVLRKQFAGNDTFLREANS